MNEPAEKTLIGRVPKWAAWLAGLLGSFSVIGGTAWAAYSHFHTDAEAAAGYNKIKQEYSTMVAEVAGDLAQYQEKTYTQFKNDRIDRHQREINRIEYQLLDPGLTPQQREYLLRRIQELRETIACIRRGEC